jgi:hypothetical protein
MSTRLWPQQRECLQTLYSLYRSESTREERLVWAAQQLGRRDLASFNDLSSGEAAQLIATLKQALGQPTRRRRPRSREVCQALGTHGRRGHVVEIAMMASPTDLAVIDDLRDQLGWTPEQFEGWLRSRSSPIHARGDLTLRTLADVNRVRWGLLALLRRQRVG